MCPDSFAARAATYSNSRWHAELAERFVVWLGRADGLTVVDIGTGTGFAALAVAGGTAGAGGIAGAGVVVGDTGASGTRVHGVDRSGAMIAVARERAAAAGRDGTVTFAVGDAHRLGLRDRCADAALFVTSLHYMTPGPALAEAERIVRPGGTVAIATLRTGTLVSSELFRAVLAEHGVAAPDRMAATGSRDQLTALLVGAGLGTVETGQDTLRLADADLADAWPVGMTMAARRLADWPEPAVAALRERWEARVAAARAADEEGFRTITMLMARARRPDR
jgi:ubiquinone/menaquinone biosynthesis C-methylase UbiE